MSDTVLDEKITAYSRSPNDEDDILVHHGVKGQQWYEHKFGNWERHARYANGQPNPETLKAPISNETAKKKVYGGLSSTDRKTARQEKKAAKKAKKAAQKKKLEETWLGKEGERPRSNITDLTSDEIKEMTNRLKIENDYLSALKNAKNLDSDLYNLTSSEGLLYKMEDKLKENAGKVGGKVGNYMLYKVLASTLGEEDAKMLMGMKGGGGKKGGGGNQGGGNQGGGGKKSSSGGNQGGSGGNQGNQGNQGGSGGNQGNQGNQGGGGNRQKSGKNKTSNSKYYSKPFDNITYQDYTSYDDDNYNNSFSYEGPRTKRVTSTVRRKQTPKKSKKR